MTDRRFLAANRRVVWDGLDGKIDLRGRRLVAEREMRCALPVADLCREPGGARDRQLLKGHALAVLEVHEGWAFGFCVADGYVGYMRAEALEEAPQPTHRVSARATHVYAEPDVKAPELESLSVLSDLAVVGEVGDFVELAQGGFVPLVALRPLGALTDDPVKLAEMLIGTPYLWGGDSAFGIDCSGLVQLAMNATGAACPRDSDLQERGAGWHLAPGARLRRGDAVFWAGHVGLMTDATTLIHANAHHMAVACEPLATARARIAAQGGGPVTALRRLVPRDVAS